MVGAAVGLFAASLVGLGPAGAVVGGLNGAVSGWRGVYRWRAVSGPVAFLLDSSWALVTTLAALAAHAVALVQRDGGYVASLSRRRDRHVYERGLVIRRRFVITVGNTLNGVGPRAATDARRRRLVTDHEHVHVWQTRWFGPLFPLLYGGWLVLGGATGAVLWLVRGRRAPFGQVVETCAYYLNPFERWAYARGDHWPHENMAPGYGSARRPVRPLPDARWFRRLRSPR